MIAIVRPLIVSPRLDERRAMRDSEADVDVTCGVCGQPNEAGRKFCGECGSPLAAACPSCASPNPPGTKFCGECGAALAPRAEPTPATTGLSPQAERRLVSVLFADLVGFTAASEGRDAEDTRELLTRYFDLARTTIERYGGTVEKFIGDAVMAVWGAPAVNEDDAERAVRAALDLVAGVPGLDATLRARAGVLTGEAAVTLGAEGQGMVAGDLVNTASRIQAEAEPGAVLVGERTKQATEAAIAYDDAGDHELKGKSEPVALFRATRVIALRGGSSRLPGIEPPFVGRDRELRLVKELFHASAADRRTHLVSVLGVGGIGKSRLAWEFEKYVDGLAAGTWWHWGRCLAYGEGVAFWALAEMIRGRAGIIEDEDSASAAAKLAVVLAEHFPDDEERRFVHPRLAHLLGLEEQRQGDEQNLFAAARMLFERLAEQAPAVLVFEDIHWADSALLDFIEYLLEWSRDRPLFLLTLARPELTERRPNWGAAQRNFTSLALDPLPEESMDVLLTGPVPGLSEELRARILERAEGVPFYAVETVRMLLDRGLIVREGNSYRPTGPIDELDVPQTLQALIAARLDGLTPAERRAVQDAAVLGRTFTTRGLTAMSGYDETELQTLLGSLIRKEIISFTSDPLSAERGQYGFLQDLVKKVAYDTLSRRERKTRHLLAAAHLRSLGEEDEVVEVVAAHYLDAFRAEPDDPDAGEVKTMAREMLVRAGARAASLGANAEAGSRFEEAAALADDVSVQAELLEQAGIAARADARNVDAIARFERSVAAFLTVEDTHAAARVSARLGGAMWDSGRVDEAPRIMTEAFEVVARDGYDPDVAALASELGRALYFAGKPDLAAERMEVALDIAESLWLPGVLSEALNTKSLTLLARGRPQEGVALLEYALKVALEADVPSAALRAYFNLAELNQQFDRHADAAALVRNGLQLARRVGDRLWEHLMLGQVYCTLVLGEWDEVLERAALLPEFTTGQRAAYLCFLLNVPQIHCRRGDLEQARAAFSVFSPAGISADIQEQTTHAAGRGAILEAEGRPAEALDAVRPALEAREELGAGAESFRAAFCVAVESSLALGDDEAAAALLDGLDAIPFGKVPPYLRASASRFRGLLAARAGQVDAAHAGFKRAIATFREISAPFDTAAALADYGEWLHAQGLDDEGGAKLSEARAVFERLRATPSLERIDRIDALTRRTAETG
jgi:class 3 adenylate cyclase/tetratricopeptide (TPR) repeat protein